MIKVKILFSRVCCPPCLTSQVSRMWRNQSLLPSLLFSVSGRNSIKVLLHVSLSVFSLHSLENSNMILTSPALGPYLQQALASIGWHSLTGVLTIHDILMGTLYIQIFIKISRSFGATGLTLIAFFELISVMYVYGHKRFTDDIENMTGWWFNAFWTPPRWLSSGVRPGPYWQIMWRFVSPALMSAVIASSIYFMLTNNPKYSAWNKELVRSLFSNIWR